MITFHTALAMMQKYCKEKITMSSFSWFHYFRNHGITAVIIFPGSKLSKNTTNTTNTTITTITTNSTVTTNSTIISYPPMPVEGGGFLVSPVWTAGRGAYWGLNPSGFVFVLIYLYLYSFLFAFFFVFVFVWIDVCWNHLIDFFVICQNVPKLQIGFGKKRPSILKSSPPDSWISTTIAARFRQPPLIPITSDTRW